MLATTSLGAVWSSCSPDFGERGVLDRFGQIEPKLFFTVDGYWYGGKAHRIAEKMRRDHRAASVGERRSSCPIWTRPRRLPKQCRAPRT